MVALPSMLEMSTAQTAVIHAAWTGLADIHSKADGVVACLPQRKQQTKLAQEKVVVLDTAR